jgi:hypothetical protein
VSSSQHSISLSAFAQVNPDARRIIESSLSHTGAAAAINALPEAIGVGYSTSRTSVIRARSAIRRPSLAEIVEPGSEPQKPVQPRRQALPQWSPGKDIDLPSG